MLCDNVGHNIWNQDTVGSLFLRTIVVDRRIKNKDELRLS